MADENVKTAEGGADPNGLQNLDAFKKYKNNLETVEIPNAEAKVNEKKKEFDMAMERRRHQMIHVKNLEENLREYQAMSFNVASILANDSKELNADIKGMVAKNKDLKALLVEARKNIKDAKQLIMGVEQQARYIDNAKDDSVHSEQMKILRRGIVASDGKKSIDDALSEIAQKADIAFDLADNAREKEIITEGVIAYIDSDSMTSFGEKIEAGGKALKTDMEANVKEAFEDVIKETGFMNTRLTELSAAGAVLDRTELDLESLQDTLKYLNRLIPPDEDIKAILKQIEDTYDKMEDRGEEGEDEEDEEDMD